MQTRTGDGNKTQAEIEARWFLAVSACQPVGGKGERFRLSLWVFHSSEGWRVAVTEAQADGAALHSCLLQQPQHRSQPHLLLSSDSK